MGKHESCSTCCYRCSVHAWEGVLSEVLWATVSILSGPVLLVAPNTHLASNPVGGFAHNPSGTFHQTKTQEGNTEIGNSPGPAGKRLSCTDETHALRASAAFPMRAPSSKCTQVDQSPGPSTPKVSLCLPSHITCRSCVQSSPCLVSALLPYETKWC